MRIKLPSRTRLHQLFEYREGVLYWRERPREDFASTKGWKIFKSRFAGQKAGSGSSALHSQVLVDGKLIAVHRIVWKMHHGTEPLLIDHRDGKHHHNEVDNLRPATFFENAQNAKTRCDNRSGFRGVSWSKRQKKWCARIQSRGQMHHLGSFKLKEDAARAYEAAARRLHGEFARPTSNIPTIQKAQARERVRCDLYD